MSARQSRVTYERTLQIVESLLDTLSRRANGAEKAVECLLAASASDDPNYPFSKLSKPPTDEEIDKRAKAEEDRKKAKKEHVEPKDMLEAGIEYITKFNKATKDPLCRIKIGWRVEGNPKDILYLAIDAVYVNEQQAEKEGAKKPKIAHWNICIKWDNDQHSQLITDTDHDRAMIQLLAFILENKLTNRHFIIFTDGESSIFTDVEKYLSCWNYTIYLDYYHCKKKLNDMLSLVMYHIRVPDPDVKREKYQKNTKDHKAGDYKPPAMTSISQLFARRAIGILFSGNVPELIAYLKNIDPALIKSQDYLNKLIGYFVTKGKYITCFALRRALGLRNASNFVEQANNSNVSLRQKGSQQSWCLFGTSALTSLKTLLINEGGWDLWFSEGQFSFCIDLNENPDAMVAPITHMAPLDHELLKQYGPHKNATR